MEVRIIVPAGTDMSVIEKEYPDIFMDEEDVEGEDTYFVGKSQEEYDDDEEAEDEWLTRDEAIQCCGFVEGAIAGADTLLEGNGDWAQGMLSDKAFSGLAISDEQKAEYERVSGLWWEAHEKGRLAAEAVRVGGGMKP